MGIFGFFLLALAGLICGLVFVASRKPDTFRVERRLSVAAAPEAIFPHINDLETWQAWSPWARKDPNAKNTFGAVRAGKGASMRWEGNKEVGTGTMTITETVPDSSVTMRLDFEKPFKATNVAQFELRPAGALTEVIWSLHGPAPLMTKIMDLLMNMDRMIGRDFEAGLANLKARVEAH
ncbi:MAG: SRPBCC family protein [Rhizobiales bacterium]|nr:SRPBCC family protein [Hyphomicrobiales bacterium]